MAVKEVAQKVQVLGFKLRKKAGKAPEIIPLCHQGNGYSVLSEMADLTQMQVSQNQSGSLPPPNGSFG
jgi:hypothetical protein